MSKMTNKLLSIGVVATSLLLTASVAQAQVYNVTTDQQAFTSIIGNGNEVLLGDGDEVTFPVTLPFDFDFFGVTKASGSTLNVNTNGFATFGTVAGSAFINSPIPTLGGQDDAIFLFHDDLDANAGIGTVHMLVQGAVGSRTLTIQYTDVEEFPSGGQFTAQMVLFEGTNVIRFNYDQNAANFAGGNADGTIGLENAAGDAGFGGPNTGNQNADVPPDNYIFTPFAPQGPELVPAGAPVPSNANPAPGAQIAVDISISNPGTADAAASTTTIYLSTDSTIDTNDTVLGTVATPLVVAGGLFQSSALVTIPAGTPAGPAFIGFIVDTANDVTEADETNNASPGAPINVDTRPDLIGSVTVNPVTVIQGGMLTYTRTIQNVGGSTSGAFNIEVRLSNNNIISTGDTLIESFDFTAGIAAGGTDTQTVTVMIPANLTVDTYFIGIQIDRLDVVDETDDTNNTPITAADDVNVIAAPQIDLQPTVVTPLMTTIVAGNTLSIDRTIVNNSTDTSGAFDVQLFLSSDNVLDANDVSIDTTNITTIAGNGSDSGTTMAMIPANTTPGMFFIIASVDTGMAVTELDETNNVLASNVQVMVNAAGAGPDLSVPNVSLSAQTAAAASSIMVTRTIMNGGSQASGSFQSGVYFSTDNVITTSDTLLTNFTIADIAVSASDGPTSITVTIPNVAPGTYFIGVIADDNAMIAESDETNNVSTAVSIVVNARIGDVNGDTVVNIMDIQTCINQAIGLIPTTGPADVNNDGNVNVLDVQQTINISLQPTP